eukprot:231574-Rhodomonas_salina.1
MTRIMMPQARSRSRSRRSRSQGDHDDRKPSGGSPERAQTPQSSSEGGVMENRNRTRARSSGNSKSNLRTTEQYYP